MNPDMDMKRILRPASLSITLDNDIIRQLGHTQRHEPHTPGYMMEQYALELKEWAHDTGPDPKPELITEGMDKTKLQEEKIILQMMARNIREELMDTARLLFAQEETLMAQERQETEDTQRKDTTRDTTSSSTKHTNHQEGRRRINNEAEHHSAKEDENAPTNGPSDYLVVEYFHEDPYADTPDMDGRGKPSSPCTCSTPR